MSHGGNNKGIIMRRPDGTPMTRSEVIVQRRGALKWMPVLFSNDLVHGSWWFVLGSAVTMLCSMYPLIQKYSGGYDHNDDILPATDYDVTWALMIVSGFFFTLGSLAFVRAFEEPPKRPLLYNYKHFQSDELLGAWLFLVGTAPSIPYLFLFFIFKPSAFYFFGTVAAIVFTYATYLFVVACYPSDKVHKNFVLPMMIRLLGPQLWIVKHLANDWLAGTWFFLWANAIVAFASMVILFISFGLGDSSQIFIWLSGTASAGLFLVGSAYFVSGSYPHAQQFYYAEGRGHIERDPAFADMNPDEVDEEVADTAKLLPSKPSGKPKTPHTPMHDAPTPAKKMEPKDKLSGPSDVPDKKEKKHVPTANVAPVAASAAAAAAPAPVPPAKIERKKVKPADDSHSTVDAVKGTVVPVSNVDKSLIDMNDLPPPPPPPAPPVVPDENQDDDDDDVDVVEENSATLYKGHGVTAADLVDKQHRRRSAGLGREQYEALSSTEPSPEKPTPIAPEVEKSTEKDAPGPKKGKSPARKNNPDKPTRKPQGPPPAPPSF